MTLQKNIGIETEEFLLQPNEYSRPQRKLSQVKAIVLHWVANTGQSAESVRDYFELRAQGQHGYGSAHYVVGLEGEIIQCIPRDEIAYHVGSADYTDYARCKFGDWATTNGSPNHFSIGIELCHISDDGFIAEETMHSAEALTAWLCEEYNLGPLDVTTHHNIVGWKDCPKWFVDYPEDLQLFQERVKEHMSQLKP